MGTIDPKTAFSLRAEAHVDLAAISGNCARLLRALSGQSELCAVVKADGYGHGMEQVARAAVAGGATRLAVVTVPEAAGLADLDLGVPLLLLAPVRPDDLIAAIQTGAELTAWSVEQIKQIEHAAVLLGVTVGIHVKLDTGMSRFGAKTLEQALAALDAAAASDVLQPAGVWTHFATADELSDELTGERAGEWAGGLADNQVQRPDNQRGDDYFAQQLARFGEFVTQAKRRHPGVLAHAANSAAVLREPESHFDFVRCGIAIYGLDPFHADAASRELRPALSLRSYVASIRPLAAGESASYGRRFVTDRDTLLATVPIGYGDGWRRALTNNADVLIGGRRLPQRGTVSMDSITVDLGPESDVCVGAPVTLIGEDGAERITTEDVARDCGTINYEITCGLTARTVRSYDGP